MVHIYNGILHTCVCPKLLQLCPTLWDPMACSSPDSSVHGILQARILEWVVMTSSRRSSWPRHQTCILCFLYWQVGSILLVALGKPTIEYYSAIKKNEILLFVTTNGTIQRYYDKWNVREHKTDTLWSHLFVESKKTKQNEQTKEKESRLIATENKLVVAWWVSWGKIGEVVKDAQTSSYKINHRNVIHSIKDMANNIVINLYRVRWLLDLSWWSFHNVFKYWITMLYSWN